MPRSACLPIIVLSLALTPLAAQADLTADQVWQNWQSIGAATGQTFVPGAVNRSGDVLTLSDVAVAAVSPEVQLTGVISRIDLRENGDGTVSVTLPDRYDLRLDMTPEAGKPGSMSLVVEQSGVNLLARGTPEALSYDYSADRIAATGADMVVDGAATDGRWSLVLDGFTQSYDVAPGALMGLTLTSAVRSLELTGSGTESGENASAMAGSLRLNGIAAATDALLPPGPIAGDDSLRDLIAAGGRADFSMTHDGGTLRVETRDSDGQPGVVEGASGGGHFKTSFDGDRLIYGVGATKARIEVSGGAMTGTPMPPVAFAIDEADLSLRAPLKQGDAPQDFALGLRLRGLAVPAEAWSMIDPGASLPRDPATVVLDLSGKMRPLVDPLDPMAAPWQGPPVELHALDVGAVELSVAGAEFKGAGALTFDNSQPPMLGGIAPIPQGKLNLSLTGATTLLAKLMELGLLDQSAAMGFGMVTAMLARPGEGPDTFVSEIESRPDGIFANGQPLPFLP